MFEVGGRSRGIICTMLAFDFKGNKMKKSIYCRYIYIYNFLLLWKVYSCEVVSIFSKHKREVLQEPSKKTMNSGLCCN